MHQSRNVTFNFWRAAGMGLLETDRGWLADPRQATIRAVKSVTGLAHLPSVGEMSDLMQRGMWAMCGYPTIRPTHRAAASWMATNYRAEDMGFVRPPWPSFVILVPTSMLWLTGKDSELEVTVIGASYHEGKWDYTVSTNVPPGEPAALRIYAYGVSTEMMVRGGIPAVAPIEGFAMSQDMERTGTDDRTDALARRLILGVCMYYSHQGRLSENKQVFRSKTGNRRDPDVLPDYTCWEMRSEISIDVVRAVKEWARTGVGKSPAVQGMVAGHGKWQAHGPKLSLRKWIHVQPYWRGPEDAPVIAHVGRKESNEHVDHG